MKQLKIYFNGYPIICNGITKYTTCQNLINKLSHSLKIKENFVVFAVSERTKSPFSKKHFLKPSDFIINPLYNYIFMCISSLKNNVKYPIVNLYNFQNFNKFVKYCMKECLSRKEQIEKMINIALPVSVKTKLDLASFNACSTVDPNDNLNCGNQPVWEKYIPERLYENEHFSSDKFGKIFNFINGDKDSLFNNKNILNYISTIPEKDQENYISEIFNIFECGKKLQNYNQEIKILSTILDELIEGSHKSNERIFPLINKYKDTLNYEEMYRLQTLKKFEHLRNAIVMSTSKSVLLKMKFEKLNDVHYNTGKVKQVKPINIVQYCYQNVNQKNDHYLENYVSSTDASSSNESILQNFEESSLVNFKAVPNHLELEEG
ncbi:hypothetical protein A3Q56_07357 [Intoshia linei]|uniref:Uncharacterized protein n=1 Tax=Intoshia linei TaxID=1819745 RepID=A0A177ASE6_9BILA|nr:hypothetical protein A3Q56_07357 [Intoshia linei]